jgi:SEC-C motif-containing protein
MRSRYAAYAIDHMVYVRQTWHANTRPHDLAPSPASRAWVRLSVKSHSERGETAMVEFVAVSKENGRAQRLHERSRFVREGGRWFYVDGDVA